MDLIEFAKDILVGMLYTFVLLGVFAIPLGLVVISLKNALEKESWVWGILFMLSIALFWGVVYASTKALGAG